ncbi:MAG: beta-lactamase family protein [Rhodospirillales bacterium]|nr:beta-lactamase family protein [Rhodospirillales bacterium]
MDDSLMAGAPPRLEDQVTLANWRQAPYSRWAFQHVRELIPTAAVAGGGNDVWALEEDRQDLAALAVPGEDGAAMTVSEVLAASETDGFLVLHRGRVVFEDYRRGMTQASPHILFSVSKSVTGILAGILVGRSQLDPEAPVVDYLPEVAGSAYDGATLRHLLDMTTGIAFVEDYLATQGPIIEYRKATGWNPLAPGEAPGDLRSFLAGLRGRVRPHGEVFRYLSPNSDLLGWVIERAAGRRFAALLGEALWRPLGAEAEASITLDRLGASRAAGGLSTTLRDLGRLGQLLLQGGARGGAAVVPAGWIADIRQNGDPALWAAGDMAQAFPGWPLRYRNQWYVLGEDEAPYLGLGIHGQMLFVDPGRALVAVKFSSQPEPVSDPKDRMAINACLAIGAALQG